MSVIVKSSFVSFWVDFKKEKYAWKHFIDYVMQEHSD